MTGNKSDASHRKYCIIHGHFYQPPRENPWINRIQRQPSAAPYHDWNERIYDECYRPNAYSRLLDPQGMIQDIHNNYTNLSFNFGPTLLMWLEKNHPVVTRRILDADAESYNRLDRHGNAIAQVYNHLIMPLASRRDQLTQIRWGKSFFRSRFGRDSEGMWLAETAINRETVNCLIEEGIRFVILSPAQAEAFRTLESDDDFVPLPEQGIDTRYPYRVFPYTKEGNRGDGFLDVFFFDEGLSRAASFEDLLTHADSFAQRLGSVFSENAQEDETVILATDGETFGHHKPFSDMCLAFFFTHTAYRFGIEPVNFGYVLAHNPSRYEVTLKNASGEGSSWSCTHGTGRWIRDCGCRTGGKETWNQKWRTPLRKALEHLQQHIDTAFEKTLEEYTQNPWALRDAYTPYENEYSTDAITQLLVSHGCSVSLDQTSITTIVRLLEAQKYMLYAFTSCGWFFSDISGIETIQNLLYACRAMQLGLTEDLSTEAVQDFFSLLDTAHSNSGVMTGKTHFEKEAVPFLKHLHILCFTAAAYKTAFTLAENQFDYYGYTVILKPLKHTIDTTAGNEYFLATITNTRSGESGACSILLIHENDTGPEAFVLPGDVTVDRGFSWQKTDNWEKHPRSTHLTLSNIFSESKTAFSDLFTEQLDRTTIMQYTTWVEKHHSILKALIALHLKLPDYLYGPLSYVINSQWNVAVTGLNGGDLSDEQFLQLRSIHEKSQQYGIPIDFSTSAPILQRMLLQEMKSFSETLSSECCDRMRYLLNIVDRFSVPLTKSRLEDTFYDLYSMTIKKLYEEYLSSEQPTSEQKTILLQIAGFARRMNFNTDSLIIT